MIALIQRVSEASITADGEFRGSIGQGLMVLVCGEKNDKLEYADALAEKVAGYRVFSDADGKMNLSLKAVGGGILVASQFTLAADTNSGTRPSFSPAADPALGKTLYERFLEKLRTLGFNPVTGVFGAHMQISLPAGNRNPQIAWSNPPLGTKSLIVICEDNDVPADFSKANVEGETIPADAPRTSFIHWVLVDIVPEEPCIDAASLSKGISPRGKRGPACANGMRQGLNDYTDAFKGDPNNEGHYYGYDGPCPPWNDERVHRYVFTVYAVDFPLLPLKGSFNGRDVIKAMKGHILASASTVGTYTLNPKLLKNS